MNNAAGNNQRVVLSGGQRAKLANYNTIDDAIDLIVRCKRIVVITGAGISVSCGIPDFRSADGFYSRLGERCKNLVSEPEEVFSLRNFVRRPSIFYRFVREIIRLDATPSFSHHFLRVLDESGKLLRNYTQNIDALECKAGIVNVEHCHGSFEWFSCTVCNAKAKLEQIRGFVEMGIVPYCWYCAVAAAHTPNQYVFDCGDTNPRSHVLVNESAVGIFKPNVVFFEEGLPISFNLTTQLDKNDCDLLIVIGSSMTVRPICTLPSIFPLGTPRILINREALTKNKKLTFDIELLGDCDVILKQISYGIIEREKKGKQLTPDTLNAYMQLMKDHAPDFVPLRMIDTIDTLYAIDNPQQSNNNSSNNRVNVNGTITDNVSTGKEYASHRITRSRTQQRIVNFMKANCCLYISPNRYIFPGANATLSGTDLVHEQVIDKKKRSR